MADEPTGWFVKHGGKVHGPYSAIQLRGIATAGKIDPDAEVRRGLDGQWTPGRNVDGLFDPIQLLLPILNPVPPEPTGLAASIQWLGNTTTKPRNDFPSHRLVRCAACRKQVSQSADSCPKCGHKFTLSVMGQMRASATNQLLFAKVMVIGCCLFFAFAFAFVLIAMVASSGGSHSAYEPARNYESNRDAWVQGESRKYMSGSEYREATQSLENLNAQGFSDSQIHSAVQSELQRRGE